MVTKTNEEALESCIEKKLLDSGYIKGESKDYNIKYGVDEKIFFDFLESTQSEELDKLKTSADYKTVLLTRLDRIISKDGILKVLREGFKFNSSKFQLMYPIAKENDAQVTKDNYNSNIFSIVRQLYYSNESKNSIDIVLFVNGLPIITMELKNPWTGQTAKYNGRKQYCRDRDIRDKIFNFARCIVHFTLDTDECYMTTKVDGMKTFFLPFNKGNNFGAGNPISKDGHKTAYMWNEILLRDTLSNIIFNFTRLSNEKKLYERTLYFPRYHQLDVVSKTIEDVEKDGVGKSYLIQHSAGSGKSNSITWLAFQLIEAIKDNELVFDSVIIVTDRRLLDKQISENVKSFIQQGGIVAPANNSKQLREHLENGKKIIITTIQKFPFIIDEISDLSNKKFGIIIDEAHSSQSGTSSSMMNQAMGVNVEEELDIQDKILEIIKARKVKDNASYFAFTATPKSSTLERFGTQQVDGTFKPFHLYSMKQAIEEGFILDVLRNYTTYKSYYEIEKSVIDNPIFNTKKAQARLKRYVENEKNTIEAKAKVMLNHFLDNVYGTKLLKGKAKAMVITQSIEQAIKYYNALNEELNKYNNPFKILIAFSGSKEISGIEYTEFEMNGFSESETKDAFDKDEYRMLVVANKYLTGFDQPKLTTMYVDKKLSGVLCVQALSRLNRSLNKYHKKSEDILVLDFYNTIEDIKNSFEPFYISTQLSEATDINVLHDIKDNIDYVGVYSSEDLENFINIYFNNGNAEELSPIIDQSVERFDFELELSEEEKIEFKIQANQFIKVYSQITTLIPFEDIEWEKTYWYLKYLVPKLKVRTQEDIRLDDLIESIDLTSYGVERVKIGVDIELDNDEGVIPPNSSRTRAIYNEEENDYLEEIIDNFNKKFFNAWNNTNDDSKTVFLNLKSKIIEHQNFDNYDSVRNDEQNSHLIMDEMLKDILIENKKSHIDLYKQYSTNEEVRNSMIYILTELIKNG